MFFIGIDWASDHHDICCLNSQGEKIKQFRISENIEGYDTLLQELKGLHVPCESLLIAIEKNHGLLVHFLLQKGFLVYPINPKSAERMRDRHHVSSKKDDLVDAFTLADALRTDLHRFKLLTLDSDIARELKALVHDREHLVGVKTRTVNQITACLREFYPAGLEIFSSLQTQTSMEFLKRHSSPSKLKQITLEEFEHFLKEMHYPLKTFKKTPESFYEELISHPCLLPVDPVVEKTKSRFLEALVGQLSILVEQIKQYDLEICSVLSRHPDNDIFRSLPGAGDTLGAKLMAHFGEGREQFDCFESVQQIAGTAPVSKKSGKMSYSIMRRSCQQSFRDAVFQFSFCSLKKSLWAKCFYDKHRKLGKTHAGALRCLANKWIKIIFTLWKNRELYREEIFLAAQQKHFLQQQAS